MELITFLAGFLTGTAVGAAGTFYGNKYTDERRSNELDDSIKQNYKIWRDKYPCTFRYIKKCIIEENSISYMKLPLAMTRTDDSMRELKTKSSPEIATEVADLIEYYNFSFNTQGEIYRYKENFVIFLKNDEEL